MSKYGWVEPVFYVLVVNCVAAGVLLVREVLLRPRLYRVLLIALSFLVFLLVLPQIETGYYLAFDGGKAVAYLAGAMSYIALMVLTVTSKRMPSGMNRTVGAVGLSVPVLIVAFAPELLFVLILTYAFDNQTPIFRGRISPSVSYHVAIDGTLSFSHNDHYRYTLFRNPQRLPFVQKKIASQSIDNCEVPAVYVSLKPEAQSQFVRIVCQQHAEGPFFTGEISLDNLNKSVFLTPTN